MVKKSILNKNIGTIEFTYIVQAVLFLTLATLIGLDYNLTQYVLMMSLVILSIISIILAYEWVKIENKLK